MSAAPPAAAPRASAVLAQVGIELRLTARRAENLLALAGIPVVVLVFFASTGVVRTPGERAVDFLLPGALALAVMAAGLVNLGIATAYERSYGVLRRLGASPLGREGLVLAKLASIGAIVLVQAAALAGVAWIGLDWRPADGLSVPLLALALASGTAAFASLGLLLAGTVRAEATLALANGLFVLAIVLGGVVLPTSELPSAVGTVADLLPPAALSDALRLALGPGPAEPRPFVILAAWAVSATALAARAFRWD
ncbi:MAG: ABC transporter permease [Candidatus Limnocylindria bacterium]